MKTYLMTTTERWQVCKVIAKIMGIDNLGYNQRKNIVSDLRWGLRIITRQEIKQEDKVRKFDKEAKK